MRPSPALLLLPVLGLPLPLLAWAQDPPDAKVAADLVVHEWGTFTTVAGADGRALEWRPLAQDSDLPGFVYTLGDEDLTGKRQGLRFAEDAVSVKKTTRGTVRMETPVLYFYTDRRQEAAVRVEFPGGRITEWFPRAASVWTHGIDWGRVLLLPGVDGPYPREATPNHYYPARETDAATVQVCSDGEPDTERERFLFYRGVGTFPLPLEARQRDDGGVVLVNVGDEVLPPALVFENRGGELRFTRTGRLAKGENVVGHPDRATDREHVGRLLQGMLVLEGLFPKEAAAMVATWKDQWFEEGLRVFWLVPRARTDAILPLSVTPRPREVQRVLVGRLELLTPAFVARIRTLGRTLVEGDDAARAAARRSLAALGRFAELAIARILVDCRNRKLADALREVLQR
ncbi:MAG: hypothetical protein R3F30_06255 [Planctomycetota bacterium]